MANPDSESASDARKGRSGDDETSAAADARHVDSAPVAAAAESAGSVKPAPPAGNASSGERAAVGVSTPRTVWTWNLPLLFTLVAIVVVGGPLFVGLYVWQSSRIGGQLLTLAENADEPREQIKWLSRYLKLRPEDTEVQVRLAVDFDGIATGPAEIDQSRRYLTQALAAVSDTDDQQTADDLQRRLIERLVQLGSGWMLEAERQIIDLDPPPGDAWTLDKLARSLAGQGEELARRIVMGEPPEREEGYWRWAASRPVGEVLELAVEANPDSVELAGLLVDAYINMPEAFAPRDGSVTEVDPAEREARVGRAADLVQRLSQRTDNGYAQWLTFRYSTLDDNRFPSPPRDQLVAAALQRLQAFDPESMRPDSFSELPRWDAQTVLAYATVLAESADTDDAEAAKDLLNAAIELPEGLISPDRIELAYLLLGRVQSRDDPDAAVATWRAGNERLGGQSLLLLEPLTARAAEQAPIDEAQAAVARLREAVEAESLRIAGAGRAAIPPAGLDQLQARLNSASWSVDALQAQVDFRKGDLVDASRRLERVLASQVAIDLTKQIEASRLLAAVYGQQNLWDLAGRVLDDASQMVPANQTLRREAASAWRFAASMGRAADQLRRADDGSFDSALALATAVAAEQANMAPAQRDPSRLRNLVEQAQRRLERGDNPSAQAWRLDLLRLSLPVDQRPVAGGLAADATVAGEQPGGPSAEPAASADTDDSLTLPVRELIELSLQYPQVPELQATATIALLRADAIDQANEALARLEAIEEVDPAYLMEVRLRFAIDQDEDVGTDALVEIARQTIAEAPDATLSLTKLAAQILRTLGRPAASIGLLMSLESDQHDPDSLLQLGELLGLLENIDSSARAASSDLASLDIDVAVELDRVVDQLKQLEGDRGTHWRWVLANRLLRQGGAGDEGRKRLSQAAVLQSEINSRRPRWARGLALAGRVAAAQGNTRQAIESLRRAVSEGDREVPTVLLLVELLNRSGDAAAAEQELARVEGLTDSVGQISSLAVGLALGQGKYDDALARARAGVAARPGDTDALLVFAQTAMAAVAAEQRSVGGRSASGQAAQTETMDRLTEEVEQSLRKAVELSRGRDAAIWQSLFRFKVQSAGQSAGREILTEIENSPLPDGTRFLTLASGYLSLRDWGPASLWLDRAGQARPADPAVPLGKAVVAEGTRDNQALIAALEQTLELAPGRDDIRRRLAMTLAANTASEVPWQRIDELVGPDRDGASQADQLYRALIMINRGDDAMTERARKLLQDLIAKNDPESADPATRMLVGIQRRRWEAAVEANDPAAKVHFDDCVQLYERLTQRTTPNPNDLFGYATMLLKADKLTEAATIRDRLVDVAPASQLALSLRLQLLKANEESGSVLTVVRQWLDQPSGPDDSVAAVTAADILIRLDYTDEAVELMADAYRADRAKMLPYIVVLIEAGQPDRAVAVCVEQFRKQASADPVRLLADAIVQTRQLELVDDEVDAVLAAAIEQFGNDIGLLEAIGTLRLTEERFEEAFKVYAQAEKLNPLSLITLNNLAIVLSEIPGRESEAVPRATRVVDLYGRNPELLDTLGVVQYRAGKLAEAETTLRDAVAATADPRFQLHLAFVLDAQSKTGELEKLWQEIDFGALKSETFTPRDRQRFEELRSKSVLNNPSLTQS